MCSCRLRPVDIEFMKALQDKVNVVPLIAKADCLTPTEIKKLKERVRHKTVKAQRPTGCVNNPSTNRSWKFFFFLLGFQCFGFSF